MTSWNLGLILCAFGIHRWGVPFCKSKDAKRDTRRECHLCGHCQERNHMWDAWESL